MTHAKPSILILLPWEETIRFTFERLILARFPDLSISTVATLKEAAERIVDVEIFMAFGVAVKEDIFVHAEKLRWVHAFGTGVDGIVDRAGLRRDVIVTSTRGIHGAPLSEIAILHMLSMARNFPRSVRAHDKHQWDRFRASLLQGKRVGILGVGLIAEALAPRLQALGMHVVGISRTARDLAGFSAWVPRDNLKKAVADLDFLVLLIPLDETTFHIINADVIGAMKKGAYIVNIARGGVIDEKALAAALHSGHLGGAALDTVHKEPLPADDPLWDAPHLIVTPHLGGFYDTYPEDCIDQIYTNISAFLANKPEQMINREARL
jgi:phosphoglycerate dehydrogenase-like enzyme